MNCNTTAEEYEAFLIIRAILSKTISPERVYIRDAKSYCAILLDDNNRKPIARLYFSPNRLQIGIFRGKDEQKYLLTKLAELYNYADNILDNITLNEIKVAV